MEPSKKHTKKQQQQQQQQLENHRLYFLCNIHAALAGVHLKVRVDGFQHVSGMIPHGLTSGKFIRDLELVVFVHVILLLGCASHLVSGL